MLVFWSIAILTWLLLLLVLLKPLFRRQGTNQPHKPVGYKRRLLVSITAAVFIVVSSASLYVYWSNGYSLLIASSDMESDMVELTKKLAQRLEQSPDNPQGWLLLAGSYTALGEYDKGVNAYEQAERYAELEAWAQIAYAEALLLAGGSLNDKAKELLEGAVASSPDICRAPAPSSNSLALSFDDPPARSSASA